MHSRHRNPRVYSGSIKSVAGKQYWLSAERLEEVRKQSGYRVRFSLARANFREAEDASNMYYPWCSLSMYKKKGLSAEK